MPFNVWISYYKKGDVTGYPVVLLRQQLHLVENLGMLTCNRKSAVFVLRVHVSSAIHKYTDLNPL